MKHLFNNKTADCLNRFVGVMYYILTEAIIQHTEQSEEEVNLKQQILL